MTVRTILVFALVIAVLTIVTVTGVTQRRGDNNNQAPAPSGPNQTDNGSGTNSSRVTSAEERNASAPPQSQQIMRGAHTTQTVTPIDMNKDLRALRHIPPTPRIELPEFRRHGDGRENEEEEKDADKPGRTPAQSPTYFDAVRQLLIPTPNMPSLNLSFDGQDLAASGCSCSPPDTVGDIGSNHYIQNVNSTVFKIWDKTGTVLQASTTFNSLWGTGGTNPCTQGLHFGDPVVFYDQIADRWVMSDFAFGTSGPNTIAPYYECIAVAKTADPVAGGWWLYAFQHDPVNTDWLGDYPKFGNWLDGWYGSYNMFCGASSCTFGARNTFQGVQVNAYDRATMLTGAPTTTQIFRLTPAQVGDSYSFLPATYRFGAPPAGRNEFYAAIDSPPTSDPFRVNTAVHIYKFHADFATPGLSTFTGPTDITVAGYIDAWNASESGNIVPQSGTAVLVDTVGDRLFMNLWYQNLGGTESLWATHTIRTTSTSPSAIRWYQFDMTGNTVPATPVQQGTWDGGGDGLYRWMPSLALDKSGNMAIGYNASDSGSFPSIRYNGRLTTDAPNTLGQGESTLVAGTGSFTSSQGRWGDYAATGIDPADGCTFWHTNEYLSVTGSNWKTRVGSFTFPACVAANDGTLTGTVTDSLTSSPLSGVTVSATSGGVSNGAITNGSGVYSITVLPGTYNLTASKAGYTNGTANGVLVTLGNTTIQNFALTSSCSPVARTWIGLGAGGAGTDFNTATNWSPNGVPQPCDNLTMTLTNGATISLSADSTINNLTTSLSGANNVFRLDVNTRTLTINGTTSANVTSGNGNTQMQFNVGASPGQIIYGGDATFAAASGITFPILGVGNTTGQVVFRGNATFNSGAGTSSGNTPAKVIFDAPATQTITDNAGTAIILLGNNSTEIGSTNSPTVTVAGSASNFQPQGNLNVNGSSTLDLTTRTFNRSAAGGGTFTLNAGTSLKLGAGTGGQTGSNFPLNFTTTTLNATSTVDYNGLVAQTIFATPAYGNLKISNASTKTATAALTVAKDITIGSGATFAGGAGLTHLIGGNWTNNGGTFSPGTSTVTFNSTTAAQTIGGTAASQTFNAITVNKTGQTLSVGGSTTALTLNGTMTLTAGTFSTGTATNINIAGNWTNNGGSFTPGSGTVTFNSIAAAQSLNGTAASQTFNKITVSKTGQTLSIGGSTTSLTVSDTLLVSAGIFDQGSSDLSANTISVGAGATLRNLGTGDLTVGSGGVTNAGTINFDGSGGPCGSADTILIRSTSAGVQRAWSGVGTFSMSDVNVQDQAGAAIITVFSGTNNGNNGSNWVFINGCTGAGGQTYLWVGPTLGNDSWTLPANWKVANSSPAVPRAAAPNDVLIFDGSSTPAPTVSAIPTQTIAALKVINGAFPSFSTSAANTLTIDPGAGLGFDIGFLNVNGSNALTIKLNSGTGNVSGTMKVAGGGHRLISNTAGAITFPSGAIFTTDTGFSGNAFGTGAVGDGAAGSVVFQSGASYNHNSGASPFGASGNPSVVTFQTGSFASYFTATGFDASGRTYATLTIGKTDPGGIVVNASQSGSGNFQFDNLVVNSTATTSSSLNYTGSGTSSITIRGNITSIGAGSGSLPDVILTAGSGGISINKPGGGAVTFGSASPRSIDLESDTTLDSGTTLNLGRALQMGLSGNKVLTANGALTPNFLATGYVLGGVRKPSVPIGSYTFPVGTTIGYTPVDLANATGGGDLTVLPKPSVQPILGSSTSLKEYWTVTLNSGSLTTDLTFNYLEADVMGTEANYRIIRVEGGTAVSFPNDCPIGQACVDTTNNQATVKGVSGFSDWTVGEPAAPTAVKLASFTATTGNDGVMLRWRTGYEARNLGYIIYREVDGKRVAITPSLVAGSALMVGSQTVLNAGHAYTWYDRDFAGGDLTRRFTGNPLSGATYWLEDVDVDGTRTLHGPIAPSLDYSLTNKGLQSQTFDDMQRRLPASGPLLNSWPAAFTAEHKKLLSPSQRADKPTLTQRDIANLPGLKIAVKKSGWYRVTVAEMLAAGFDPRGRTAQMQLYANASEVPIRLSGDGKLATLSDCFEFYGHGLDSPTDAAQTYYLLIGDTAGKRISLSAAGKPGAPSGPQSFDYTIERKDRLIYYAGLLNGDGENIFGALVSGSLASETLPVTHLDSAGAESGAQAVLEVSLVGVTKQVHNVSVRLNGQEVGTINFSNNENPAMIFKVAASLLREGDNEVQLTALNGELDISLIDTMRLTYPHLYAADQNVLAISLDNAKTRRITGFTEGQIRAVDISDPGNVVELQTLVTQDGGGSYSADVQVSGASRRSVRTLLVFANSASAYVDRITTNQPSSWWSHTSGDDYIIITSNELRGSVESLAALRRNQGLVVDVVDVEDLYDEFSYGQHTPSAIRDFLQTAATSWQRKPHFVLLAGDSSFDPNDYLGQGQPDVVPTKLLDTTFLETASDDWLADFDDDGVADLAIGRLPVSTPAAMDALVAKIIAYENMPIDPLRGAMLVADNAFESASDTVKALLPPDMPVQVINRSSADDTTTHTLIVESLNHGPMLANYFGHGNNAIWTGAPLLSSEDAPALTNQNRPTVFVMMTCFNGYFQDVFSESLAEALLKSSGGAAAVWASSGMTEPAGQNQIDEALFRQLFGGASPTLGDAVRVAKRTTNDRDVRLTWVLFGDPATRLR